MHYFKIVTLLIGMLGFFNSHAQTDARQYTDSISKLTGIPYMNMFGTKLLIPKPKNFLIRNRINVMEIFNDSAELIAEINAQELPVYEFITEPINAPVAFGIQGCIGKLYRSNDKGVTTLTFLGDDAESKIYIEIIFGEVDEQTEEQYINTMKTIRYDKNIKINTQLLPFLARFTVDMAGTGYSLIGITKGAYRYSPNGLKPKSIGEPQMWIREHNTSNISDLRELDLPTLPMGIIADSVVKIFEEPIINGFKVYTVYMYFGVAPNRLLVYQAARTNGAVSVVMTGIATSDFEKHRALFTKIAQTVQVRGGNEIKLFTN